MSSKDKRQSMKTELNKMKEKLKLAEQQRLTALVNAYKTIDEFATPSLSPDQFEKYEEVKLVLLERYEVKEEVVNCTCSGNHTNLTSQEACHVHSKL